MASVHNSSSWIMIMLFLIGAVMTMTNAQVTLHSWYHRTAIIDLDQLWNEDVQRIESNLDSAVLYCQSLGVNTVSLLSSSAGQPSSVYFSNPVLPDRGAGTTATNLIGFASDKFTSQGFKIVVQLPILKWVSPSSEIATENNLVFVKEWDPKTKTSAVPTSCSNNIHGCRLSPFSTANYNFVLAIYRGLVTLRPSLQFIAGGIDGVLSATEDCSIPAIAAYVDAGLPVTTCEEVMGLTGTNLELLTKVKAEAISKFYGDIIQNLRTVGDNANPNLTSIRNFYYEAFQTSTGVQQFAQSALSALPQTDLISLRVFPFTKADRDNGINPASKAFNWYFKSAIDLIKEYDPNLSRTQLVLQTQYISETTKATVNVDPLMLREWVRHLVEDLGAYHIALAPVLPLFLTPPLSTPFRQLLEKANNRCTGTETPDPAWKCPATTSCAFSPTSVTCRTSNLTCITNPLATNCPIVPNCTTSVTTIGCTSYRCTLNPQAPGCHLLHISSIDAIAFNPLSGFSTIKPGQSVDLSWGIQTTVFPTATTASVIMSYQPYSTALDGQIKQFIILDQIPTTNLSTGTITIVIPDTVLLGRNVQFTLQYLDLNDRDQFLYTDPSRGYSYTVPFCADPTSITLTNDSTLPFAIQYDNRCVGGAQCDVLGTGKCLCNKALHENYTPMTPYDLCDQQRCREFVTCQNQGLCLDDVSPYKCLCDTDLWSGNECQINQWCAERIRSDWCLNGGSSEQIFVDGNSKCEPNCTCPGKWTGHRCQTCSIICRNGGNQTSTCGCQCPSGFSGSNCQCRTIQFQLNLLSFPRKIDYFYTRTLRSFFTSDSEGNISLIPSQPSLKIGDTGIIEYLRTTLIQHITNRAALLLPDEMRVTTGMETLGAITTSALRFQSVLAMATTTPFSIKIIGTLQDNCSADKIGNTFDDLKSEWEKVMTAGAEGEGEGGIGIQFETQNIQYTVTTTYPDETCDDIYTIPNLNPTTPTEQKEQENTPETTNLDNEPQFMTSLADTIPTQCIQTNYTSKLDGRDIDGNPIVNKSLTFEFSTVLFLTTFITTAICM